MAGIDFPAEPAATSPEQEWLSRVDPFLPADAEHQKCLARARDLGLTSLECFCSKPDRCMGPCCNPEAEEW